MIERVKRFPAYLQVLMLGEPDPLAEGCVEAGLSVQTQVIPPAGSIVFEQRFADRESGGHGVGVEKRQRVQLRSVAIHGSVDGGVAVVGTVQQQVRDPGDGCGKDGGRQAGLAAENAALAPSTEKILLPAVETIPKRD